MTPHPPDQGHPATGPESLQNLADALKDESTRLLRLAEQLKAREQALAEMEANYPHFRQFVYAHMRAVFEQTLPELPDRDLESVAQEEGGQPLEAFIGELERGAASV